MLNLCAGDIFLTEMIFILLLLKIIIKFFYEAFQNKVTKVEQVFIFVSFG